MELNRQQKEELYTREKNMRSDATGIKRSYEAMKAIDPKAAGKAVAGIIQYLQEPLDTQHKLDELEQMWDMGLLEKAYYEKQKAELTT